MCAGCDGKKEKPDFFSPNFPVNRVRNSVVTFETREAAHFSHFFSLAILGLLGQSNDGNGVRFIFIGINIPW